MPDVVAALTLGAIVGLSRKGDAGTLCVVVGGHNGVVVDIKQVHPHAPWIALVGPGFKPIDGVRDGVICTPLGFRAAGRSLEEDFVLVLLFRVDLLQIDSVQEGIKPLVEVIDL